MKTFPDVYPEGLVTGYFGSLTENAVRRFQEKQGIEAVGIVGPVTRAKLNELTVTGAGHSGNIPSGLLKAPGLQEKPSTPTSTISTPSGTIPAVPATPAQPIGQTGTTTVPAIPAQPATPGGENSPPPPPTPPPTPPSTPPADTTAPSIPTNLSTTVISTTQISLSWSASTDNVAVTGYKVFRGGIQITTTSETSYTDSSLSPGTSYNYTVSSYDAAGNNSNQSASVSATTQSPPPTPPPPPPPPPAPTPTQIDRFNSSTSCELTGIAVKNGLIYVTEQSHQMSMEYVCTRVRIVTTSGNAVRTIGNKGDGPGEFSMPIGIDVSSDEKIYVADDFSHNIIQIFSSGTSTSWNLFTKPKGVAIGASGIYVADFGNDRIKKMDSNGNLLLQWGSYGFGNGQFNLPNDVAVDGAGNVYVLETASNRVQKFTADVQFIWMVGFTGPYGADGSSDPGYFSGPRGIGIDATGNLYVADTGNHRVQKFSPSGQFLFSWGSQGSGVGQFILPTDVAVDENGYIYVTNGAGSDFRIQKFAP